MAEMTTKELTAYLQCAAELESSVYRQEMAIDQAKEDLQFPYPQKKYVQKPVNKADRMVKPTAPTLEKSSKFITIFFSIIGGYSLFMSVMLIAITLKNSSSLDALSFAILAANLALGFGIISWTVRRNRRIKETNAKRSQEYKIAVEHYEWEVTSANQKYKKDLALYQKESEAAQKEYKEAYAIAKQNFSLAEEAVSQLNLPYEEALKALEKLYSAEIIFPKYRNMIAMCTMYEYFVTGRCTELTGPNGAYNLYEAELRQNLIINHLDTIADNLEAIKDNQYTLYQEMSATNHILSGISSDIEDLLSGTREIANAVNIIAHCAKATEKNTEALKYITLLNG